MKKVLLLLFISLSLKGIAQSKLDIAISNFKKLYAENVKPPFNPKIYYNKSERKIDIGLAGSDWQIPLQANVIYKYDTSSIAAYTHSQQVLIFSWEFENKGDEKNAAGTEEKSIEIVFKTKDACYHIIDAIVEIRQSTEQKN